MNILSYLMKFVLIIPAFCNMIWGDIRKPPTTRTPFGRFNPPAPFFLGYLSLCYNQLNNLPHLIMFMPHPLVAYTI